DPRPPIVSLLGVLPGSFRVTQIRVNRRQARVSGSEIGVEFDRAPEKRDRLHLLTACAPALPEGKSLERLQRGGRELLDREVETPDRGQGFAQCPAQPGRRRSDGWQGTVFAL